ncbi:MAG: LPXTG cell wall anchor domain-containing protein [Oscillospiraceae bacterium]|nr:LPXTG cell wall anchor domain-containing protein [Oscillospiraceae bacterium]
MKRKTITHAAQLLCVLALAMTMTTAAFAADPPEPGQPSPCYPTAVTRSEDGGEIRKMYDLGPEDDPAGIPRSDFEHDPAGIPRSDFEQEGYHYTLTDLLKQELPANESRQHTETVSVPSQSKDMGAVLALLPQTKEFVTEDGLAGTLALKLDTVKVEVAGYGSATKSVTATRTYPGLADQDTQYIPKSISDNGHSLTLQTVNWQTEGDGHFTAVASYSGSATSSYVKGYTVTADYAGTVSRINLNKIRYVAIFEGTALEPTPTEEPGNTADPSLTDPADPTAPVDPSDPTDAPTGEKNSVLPVVAVVVVVLLGGGAFYFIKRRR